ncbi:GIY-YIG nuclease family protein [Litorivicinus sp.]|nr:GIY-YIG nuclease family protein [Litorivicinus sp.]
MDFEYVYLLKNDNIPRLVKFGTTKNDPIARAKQLSQETGVPGRYRVVTSWRVKDGYKWEQFVFSRLSSFRKTGEFFELSSEVAINKINIILSENGALEDIEKYELEQAKAQEQELYLGERRNRANYLWIKNEPRIMEQSLREAERRLGYTEKSIDSEIANLKQSSVPYRIAETVEEPLSIGWMLLNLVTLFIPMIITFIFFSATSTKLPSGNEIAGSMDSKTSEKLNALNQKSSNLHREQRRLFEIAKKNFYRKQLNGLSEATL